MNPLRQALDWVTDGNTNTKNCQFKSQIYGTEKRNPDNLELYNIAVHCNA